jgi:glutamate racemase
LASSAPLGAFDSGVGGLSILKEVRKLLPHEDLIYLADTAHCPYGTKPLQEIRRRTLEVTDYLVALGAKAIVVACNSACVAGLDQIREAHPGLPVIGVEPAIKPAQTLTKNGKIGVLATQLTLNGERFSMLVEKYGEGIEVYTQPAPGLVELAEAGEADSAAAAKLIHQYLDPLLKEGVDTLVLGCTHFPFFRPLIERIGGPGLTVLDTGLAVARQTRRVLEEKGLMNPGSRPGQERFLTSGDPEQVTPVVRKLWDQVDLKVAKAEI